VQNLLSQRDQPKEYLGIMTFVLTLGLRNENEGGAGSLSV